MTLLLLASGVAVAQTAGNACDTLRSDASLARVDRKAGRTLQQALFDIYKDQAAYLQDYNDQRGPLRDGKIGTVTRRWLRQFCLDFKIEPSPTFVSDVIAALRHFGAIARAHPDWKTTLLSPAFEAWINQQPEPQQVVIYKIRRSGTEAQIISLLNAFDRRQPSVPRTPDAAPAPEAPAARPGPEDDATVSYVLTADDLKELKKNRDFIDGLNKLQDEAYGDKAQFESALASVAKNGGDTVRQFGEVIAAQARQPSTYKLTDDALDKLKAQNVPPDVLKQLEALKGVEFPSQSEVQKAVQARLTDLVDQYELVVSIYGQEQMTSRLTPGAVDRLRAAGMPADVLTALRPLQGMAFASQSALQDAVQEKINGLIDRYRARVLASADTVTTYQVTDQSVATLKAKNVPADLLNALKPLQGKTYASPKILQAEVDTRLQEVTSQYTSLILKHGKFLKLTYKLTNKSFRNLKKSGLPADILDKLQALKGRYFLTRGKFRKAVAGVLQPILEPYAQYPPLMVEAAETDTTYTLSDNALSKLQREGLPAAVREPLQGLRNTVYPNQTQFGNAVADKLQAVAVQYRQYPPQVAGASEVETTYTLTDQSVKDLKSENLPEHVLERLLSLQKQGFSSKMAFDKAVREALQPLVAQYAQYAALVARTAEEQKTYELTKKSLDQLNKALPGLLTKKPLERQTQALPSPADADPVFAGLETLQDVEYPTAALFEDAVMAAWIRVLQGADKGVTGEQAANAAKRLWTSSAPLLLKQARKVHPFDASRDIAWQGEPCGCVLDSLSGVVYGFYPFWQAGKPQMLNFSVISRVGYYAVTFDDNGVISAPGHWTRDKSRFLNAAGKYRTDVDLVIYQNHWPTWSRFSTEKKLSMMRKLSETLTANIMGLLDLKLPDFFSRIKPVLSLPFSLPLLRINDPPTMGDGVTLYFEGYPTDDDAVYFFDQFIDTLRAQMRNRRKTYALNLVVPFDALGRGIYQYDSLKARVENQGDNVKVFVLVFLPEPTSDNKKALRRRVEDHLHGDDRRTLLRHIVPVLMLNLQSEAHLKQFADDIIYFEDNFGGVGFWPLPVEPAGENGADGAAGASVASQVDVILVDAYQQDGARPVSAVCKVVCPHRWTFRLGWDVSMGLLLVAVGLYFVTCEWRPFLMTYFLLFLLAAVVTFLLFLALLFCDPFLQNVSKGNGILILVIIGVILFAVVSYVRKKRQAENP